MARSAELCIYTVLNSIYGIIFGISTFLLIKIFTISEYQTLTGKEIAFIALYWFPGGIVYLCLCVGFIFMVIGTNPAEYHNINLGNFLYVCFNIVSCGRMPPDNILTRSCGTVFRKPGMLFLNTLFILTTAAAVSGVFLPIFVISALYHRGVADTKYAALFIQAGTILIDVVIHIFLLDVFEYLSLAIILLGMSYIFFGLTACYLSRVLDLSFASFMWIQFEIVSLWMMLTISFAVRYEDITGLHMLIVAFFINYVCPNLPFSKIYLFDYYIENIAVRRSALWSFVTGNNPAADDWTTFDRKEMKDRFYYVLHSALHMESNFYPISIDESTSLIQSVASNQQSGHAANSTHCFKLQHEFHSGRPGRKNRILNKLHPNYLQVIWMDAAISLYAISSVVALLYPMVWFCVIWLYMEEYLGSGAILGGTIVSEQYFYLWIIGLLYSSIALFWVGQFAVTMWKEGAGIANRMNAAVFVWSIGNLCYDISDCKRLLERKDVVETVLDDERMEINNAMIVLSYLY